MSILYFNPHNYVRTDSSHAVSDHLDMFPA